MSLEHSPARAGKKVSPRRRRPADVDVDPAICFSDEHQVAARLGLSVLTLRRWRWSGGGPAFVKLGSAVRYSPQALADFVAAGERSSTSAGRQSTSEAA